MKIGEDVDYEWDILVIGNDIHAVRYAYENKVPILFNCMPFFHSYEASSNDGFDTLEEEWAFKSYSLYEWCLNPFANSIDKIRIDSSNRIIKIFTVTNSVYTISYSQIHLFDLENIFGLEENFSFATSHFRVLDWFDARGLSHFSSDRIETRDKFINNIIFFNSTRMDGHHGYRDIVCESFLSQNQLKGAEYTDTMARFKVQSILKQNGLNNTALKFWKREIGPVRKVTTHKEPESVFWSGG